MSEIIKIKEYPFEIKPRSPALNSKDRIQLESINPKNPDSSFARFQYRIASILAPNYKGIWNIPKLMQIPMFNKYYHCRYKTNRKEHKICRNLFHRECAEWMFIKWRMRNEDRLFSFANLSYHSYVVKYYLPIPSPNLKPKELRKAIIGTKEFGKPFKRLMNRFDLQFQFYYIISYYGKESAIRIEQFPDRSPRDSIFEVNPMIYGLLFTNKPIPKKIKEFFNGKGRIQKFRFKNGIVDEYRYTGFIRRLFQTTYKTCISLPFTSAEYFCVMGFGFRQRVNFIRTSTNIQ